MDVQELNYLLHDFVLHNDSISPRMASILTNARVVNAVNGCEIRIEVISIHQEEWINEHIGELKDLLNQPGSKYSSLLPVRFTYLRVDGTVIKAQEKAPRPKVEQKTHPTMTSGPFKFPTREEMFQASVSNEINSSVTRLMNLVNSVDSSNNTAECKASFVTILEERTKVLSVEPSFVYADRYLSIINEPLSFIKNRLGADSDYYRDASNVIVNTYLDILIKIVNSNPSLTNVKEAENRTGQLYDFATSENTKTRVVQTNLKLVELGQSKTRRQTDTYNSQGRVRPSVKIHRFADSLFSVKSGNRRYTSPLLGWITLPIHLVGWIVSLFDNNE